METGSAIVIDSLHLVRVGIETVLARLDISVTASYPRATDGVQKARTSGCTFFIAGYAPDLKQQNALATLKALKNPPKVLFLVDRAARRDVALLISRGADALLLRSASVDELIDAIRGVTRGERVIAPALAAGTIGRVGPTMDVGVEEASNKSGLSPRELEVLAELADGATYDEIAATLVVTKATVKTHLIHIYEKLEVKNRNEAVARALALGVLG